MVGLSASMPEGRVIPASEIVAKIKAGEPAEFDSYTIVGNLNLSALKIDSPAHFNNTIFQNSVNCTSAAFSNAAYFRSSKFNGYVDFGDSKINKIHFTDAQFDKEAQFDDSLFTGIASFNNSRFKDDALFENTTFKDLLYLTRTKYDKLNIKWAGIQKGLGYDESAYQQLIENFKKLSYSSDVDNAIINFEKISSCTAS